MPLIKTSEFKAWGSQYDFLMNDAHFSIANGGIGSGKSIGGAMRAILASLGYVGNKTISTPNLGVVTAPTYPMLKDASLRTYLDYADSMGIIKDFNKNEMRIELVNGSEILFRSADNPDRLRGPTISWWWGDEAAYCDASTWDVMVGRLRQFGNLGYAWLTTTPKGQNWIWKLFVQNPTEQHVAFRLRTLDNPFLDPMIYETWAQTYVGDFALQELEGLFIAFKGLIYALFDRMAHTTSIMPSYRYTVAGVDWGYNNPGVILVGAVNGDGKLTIIHEEHARERRIEEWVNVAQQIQNTYQVESWWCDPSEPENIAKFQNVGINALKADNSVTPGIQAVSLRLANKTLSLHNSCVHTASEFEQYQWAKHKDGYSDTPLKANDHTMDALRYLIYNHDEKAVGNVRVGVKQYA